MMLSLLLCRPGTHDPAGALVARVEGASGDVCHIAVTTDQDGGAWCVEAASLGDVFSPQLSCKWSRD